MRFGRFSRRGRFMRRENFTKSGRLTRRLTYNGEVLLIMTLKSRFRRFGQHMQF